MNGVRYLKSEIQNPKLKRPEKFKTPGPAWFRSFGFRISFAISLIIAPSIVWASESSAPLTLWYRQPAAKWTEAVPLGNGRLGAMVFGGITNERIQMNEITIWAGPPYPEPKPGGPAV